MVGCNNGVDKVLNPEISGLLYRSILCHHLFELIFFNHL
jgi:hypothetical protein